MEDNFYKGRLIERHSLSVLAPDGAQRGIVHQVIYDELCLGVIRQASRQKYIEIMDGLVSQGAEAVILGCTEIGLLVGVDDCRVPVFDTTRVHAEAAVANACRRVATGGKCELLHWAYAGASVGQLAMDFFDDHVFAFHGPRGGQAVVDHGSGAFVAAFG
jgi:hypothetical protein